MNLQPKRRDLHRKRRKVTLTLRPRGPYPARAHFAIGTSRRPLAVAFDPISTNPVMHPSPFLSRRRALESHVRSLAAALLGLGSLHPALAQPSVSEDVVELSAFTVDASQDDRYRASNSISATRTRTPIADLPVSMQVFTQEFLEDERTPTRWGKILERRNEEA